MNEKKKIRKIIVFSGEASGDLQGAMLVRELKKIDPHMEFSGTGGIRMKEEGVKLLFDSTVFGVIGPWEGIKKIPTYYALYNKAKKACIETKPDLIIFIDTPAFNIRLARVSKKMGIKSVYYFPPSAWSGNEVRAGKIADSVDLVINTFEYSARTYDRGGVKHYYTGHPLVDYMQKWVTADRSSILKDLEVDEGPVYMGLLPGSRTQEIKNVLPLLIEVGEELYKRNRDLFFLIPIASPLLERNIEHQLEKAGFPHKTFAGRAQDIMAVSRLVIMASGSAALEAGILKTPMILTYRINWLDYEIIKKFGNVKWVGLPNLILRREIVPELLQENATVDKISKWSEDLINDTETRAEMIRNLDEMNRRLGEPGMIARIAGYIRDNVL